MRKKRPRTGGSGASLPMIGRSSKGVLGRLRAVINAGLQIICRAPTKKGSEFAFWRFEAVLARLGIKSPSTAMPGLLHIIMPKY